MQPARLRRRPFCALLPRPCVAPRDAWPPRGRGLRLPPGTALGFQLLELAARLLGLEPFLIGAGLAALARLDHPLPATLDGDRLCASLGGGGLDLIDRTPGQSDFLFGLFLLRRVLVLEEGQQRQLLLLGDGGIGIGYRHAGLLELLEQKIHRHTDDFRELLDCDFRHIVFSPGPQTVFYDCPPCSACSANQGSRAFMISCAAFSSSSVSSMASSSSTDCSARSSMLTTPWEASL